MHMFNITINKKKKEHEHRDFIFIEYVCEECKEGDWSSEIIPKRNARNVKCIWTSLNINKRVQESTSHSKQHWQKARLQLVFCYYLNKNYTIGSM